MENVRRNFTLEQAMKSQRGRTGIAPFLFNPRWGWLVNAMSPPPYPRQRDLVSTLFESGWPTEPFWTGVENLAPSGIRSPENAFLSESQYRLRNARYTSQILAGESEGKRPFGRQSCTARKSICLRNIVIFRSTCLAVTPRSGAN